MTTTSGTARQVSVSRVIAAEPAAIFAVLADPAKHGIIDGSGTVKQAKGNPQRLSLGSKFSMGMKMGVPYSTKNTVVEFDEGRLIAWQHFGKHRWRYTLEPVEGGTSVTETFDWSTARSPWFIEKMGYPQKHPADMTKTLERLDTYVTNGEVPGSLTAMGDPFASLLPLGWDDGWAAALAEVGPDARPARVLQHHGAGLVLAFDDGPRTVMFTVRLDPEPTVGDWVAVVADEVVAVLPRRSLLRRRASNGGEQQLAANIDRLLLVCGLDRPVKDGRIQRGTAIAHDAGAEPVVVLTKSQGPDAVDPEDAAAEVRAGNPGVPVVITSVREGVGLEELSALIAHRSVALLGESGAGKSSIVNALLGTERVAVGEVRAGDAKGRHTTTTRELHLLADDGVLIDSPGIREVGLVAETDAVEDTFPEIAEVAETCRFSDCSHGTEPGCAIRAALEAGEIDPVRLERWKVYIAEAEASQVRANPVEARKAGKRFAKMAKEVQRRKGRT